MIHFKLKCRPEDFVVDEIATLPIVRSGPFAVFELEKRGWNTVDALRRIAQEWKIAPGRLAYGGKKDRHGETRQWITVAGPAPRELALEPIRLRFLGHSDRPMDATFIQGNRFRVTVRHLSAGDLAGARKIWEGARRFGWVNYYDDQRFGGYDPLQGFMAEKILKHHWNGAFKAFLLSIHPQDGKAEKERKRALDAHWKDWKACRELARTGLERAAFEHLLKHPQGFLPLLLRLPREAVAMPVSAYQSFLWNALAARWLEAQVPLTRTYPGAVGDHRFPAETADLKPWQAVRLPLLGDRAVFPDARAQTLQLALLAEQGLAPYMLRRIKVPAARFKPTPRAVIVCPQEARWEQGPDEVYPGREKLVLSFILPSGSYATLLVKNLFAR